MASLAIYSCGAQWRRWLQHLFFLLLLLFSFLVSCAVFFQVRHFIFFYGSASFDRQKRPLFLFEKMAPLFRMRAPPSQSVHLSRSLSDLLPFFFCFYKIQDSIGLKCFKIKCSKFTSLKLIFAFDCLIELEKNFKNEEKSGKFSRVHFEFLAIFSYFLRQFSKIISLNLISKISFKIKKKSKKYGKFN